MRRNHGGLKAKNKVATRSISNSYFHFLLFFLFSSYLKLFLKYSCEWKWWRLLMHAKGGARPRGGAKKWKSWSCLLHVERSDLAATLWCIEGWFTVAKCGYCIMENQLPSVFSLLLVWKWKELELLSEWGAVWMRFFRSLMHWPNDDIYSVKLGLNFLSNSHNILNILFIN